MQPKPYIQDFITKLTTTIQRSQNQWKGSRFASVNDSDSEGENDDDFGQYDQFMEKYRGKNGDIKPLGLLVYRKFICSLIWLCLILTIVSLPVVLVYSTGGGISEFQKNASFSKSLLLFSIANLPHYRFDNLTEDNLDSIWLHRSLAILTDTLGIILVIAFLLYWRVIAAKMANSYVAKSPSPHLYCLQVKNILGRTEQQLRDHFKKFGKLAQISCIYNDKNLLVQLTKIVKLVTKYKHLVQTNNKAKNITDQNDQIKTQKIQMMAVSENTDHPKAQQEELLRKIQQLYEQIAGNYLKLPQPQIKQCFICFEDIHTRNKVADLYKYDIMPEKLSFDGSSMGHLMEPQQLEQEHENHQQKQTMLGKITPGVKKCRYEPLTLNWQNFDIDKFSQILKIVCQSALLVIMLFMILLALFLLNINSSHVKEQLLDNTSIPSNTDIDTHIDTNTSTHISTNTDTQSSTSVSYQQLLKNPQRSNPQIMYTFCASLTYSTFKWQYYSLCSQYFSIERNKFALMLIFSLLVAVINLLTNRILWALVAFRQYRTLAQRNRFLIKSIFMFSLINSAVLILFIREQHMGPILRNIVTYIFGFKDESMRVTVYSQFNRQWYMNIGNQLMMNYVVSLVVFPHFHIILHWSRKKIRQYQSKKKGKPINDPNFNYCTFYALSLKAFFFTMLYSGCMPVFYLLCFLALNVQLYVGKFLVNRFVKQPVYVDNNAIQVAVDMIPYSLLLHCFINVFFLNVDEIFPTQDAYFNMRLSFLDRNLRRMEGGYMYLVIMVLIALFIWNSRRIYKILIKYWLGKDSSKIQCDLDMKFSELKNNPAFLSSYKMRDNPKYKIVYRAKVLFQTHMNLLRNDLKTGHNQHEQSQRSQCSQMTNANYMHELNDRNYQEAATNQQLECKQVSNQQQHQQYNENIQSVNRLNQLVNKQAEIRLTRKISSGKSPSKYHEAQAMQEDQQQQQQQKQGQQQQDHSGKSTNHTNIVRDTNINQDNCKDTKDKAKDTEDSGKFQYQTAMQSAENFMDGEHTKL